MADTPASTKYFFFLEISNSNLAHSYTQAAKEKLFTYLDQDLRRVYWSSSINTNGVKPDYILIILWLWSL